MTPLFDNDPLPRSCKQLEEGAVLLRGFATAEAPTLVERRGVVRAGSAVPPPDPPGGYTMSVAMTNCGRVGCPLIFAFCSPLGYTAFS
jgi:alkylated DNA repair protein (DNA oxidative demethylase)